MKKNKKPIKTILLIVIFILLALVVVYSLGIIHDRQNFIKASRQSEEVINSIAKEGEADTKRYCQHNNLKYSKGTLSCFIISTKTTGVSSLLKIANVARQTGWNLTGNNDIALNDSQNTYIIANLYKNGIMNCFIREKRLSTQQFELEVGCSGPAKAEWFPVREE